MKKSNNFCKINITSTLIVIILFMLGLMGIFTYSMSQNSPWTRKADMLTARAFLSTSVVDGKIYAIGGRSTINPNAISSVEQYDPATNTWTPKAPLPTAKHWMASSAVNGKIYVIGGTPGTSMPAFSTVDEYDPVTNTWATKAPMPTARGFLTTSVINGKIYAIGGAPSSSENGLRTVEMYDPVTDSWTTKTPMPTARMLHSAAVVNEKIYVIGGARSTSSNGLRTVEMYDPVTDSWTKKSDMPTIRITYLAASTVNEIIYVCGGSTDHSTSIATVEAYDPATDTWSRRTNMPSARVFFSTSVVNEKIYAVGGTVGDPWLGISKVEEYDHLIDLIELVDYFSLDKYFVVPESDICITTKINDPTGVTLFTKIQAPDQTTIDSLQLFDDGNHNDENAGDGLFANVWLLTSVEERPYYMDLQVTKTNTDTIVQCIDNMALFTTIGPLVFEELTFGSSDTEPNPGDDLSIKIVLKNESSTITAANVDARIISLDTLSTVNTDVYKHFRDIAPGESKANIGYYSIAISEDCPDSTELQFILDITSNEYSFWRDTCSILVVESTTEININENTPRQFSLDQNYPNPFNPKTVIGYSLPVTCEVDLSIYNILGQKIVTLVHKQQNAGSYKVNFDASNLSSDIYIYNLHGDGVDISKKMVLMK